MRIFNMKKVGFLLLVAWLPTTQAAEIEVGQQKKSFVVKGVTIEQLKIKAGDTLRFKNHDPFFHNVFSLSEIKTFDIGSFPAGDSRTVTFSQKGTVDIECAIHPEMQLKLEVQ